jgi:hypothetical protein
MGIGFVLLLLLILALGIAGGCSLLLAALTRKFTSRAGPKDRKRALMAVVVLPPVCVVCGLVGFGVYAAWCDSRGVDPGIGDSWFVPLGSGYRLAFVDIADQAFLLQQRNSSIFTPAALVLTARPSTSRPPTTLTN